MNHIQEEEGKDSNDPGWCIRKEDGVIWCNTVNLPVFAAQFPGAHKDNAIGGDYDHKKGQSTKKPREGESGASECTNETVEGNLLWVYGNETPKGPVATGKRTNETPHFRKLRSRITYHQ